MRKVPGSRPRGPYAINLSPIAAVGLAATLGSNREVDTSALRHCVEVLPSEAPHNDQAADFPTKYIRRSNSTEIHKNGDLPL